MKRKIAILGGGLGSLATAYWLTEAPNAADEFEITVYQMGWRLGGKGASGRSMEDDQGRRIEEHGLHIWFGFYENAFRTYRGVMEALRALPDPPVRTFTDWREAFRPHSLVVLGDNGPDGLEEWPVLFPDNDRKPGIGERPSDWTIFVEFLKLGRDLLEGHFAEGPSTPPPSADLTGFSIPEWAKPLLRTLETIPHRTLLHVAHAIAWTLPSDPSLHVPGARTLLAELLAAFRATVRLLLAGRVPGDVRDRRVWVVSDLLATIAIGILRDDLVVRGFEAVDGEELMAWLERHGADPTVTLRSNIVRVLYDLVFAYEGGLDDHPNIAAGTGAKIFLLVMGGYSGSIMFKMQSGMGDTIFTPLYGVLKSRGVRFEFFHRVDRIRPGDSGMIDEIHLTRQVELKAGYEPLVRVGEFDVWPNVPRFEQIVDGDQLKSDPFDPGHAYDLESRWTSWKNAGQKILRRGEDFDLVVLGIPPGALGEIAGELADRSPTWRRMLRGDADHPPVATVRTQAAQLWFRETTAELGWVPPAWMREAGERGETAGLLGGYLQPFNTWADMSQVLPREAWPPDRDARSVSYLCGQMSDDPNEPPASDHAYPRTQRELVRATAERWLDQAGQVLWPNAGDPRSKNGLKADLVLSTFHRANIDPSERYVLSLAGTTDSRPPANGPDFPNLFLAGDWTRNPVVNAGCVEATIAAGMVAARAISGFPKKIAGD